MLNVLTTNNYIANKGTQKLCEKIINAYEADNCVLLTTVILLLQACRLHLHVKYHICRNLL